MADKISKERRSWNMSRIKGKDTSPERIVRSILHRLRFRFRLHGQNLPGRPDIVLPKYRTVVFVNGCFWHCHRRCKKAAVPKTRSAWWRRKLEGNVARDSLKKQALRKLGWRVLVVWECETKNVKTSQRLQRRLARISFKSFPLI